MGLLRSFLKCTGLVTKEQEELANRINESARVKGLFGGENVVLGRGTLSEKWETDSGRRMYRVYGQYLCFVDKTIAPEDFIKLYKLDRDSLQKRISVQVEKIMK